MDTAPENLRQCLPPRQGLKDTQTSPCCPEGYESWRLQAWTTLPKWVSSPAQTYLLGLMANRLCLSWEGQLKRENLEVREIMMRGVKLKCIKPSQEITSGWVTGPIRDWGLVDGAQKGRPAVRGGPGIINTGQDAQLGSSGWKYWGHSKNNYPAWFALQVL